MKNVIYVLELMFLSVSTLLTTLKKAEPSFGSRRLSVMSILDMV